MPSPLVPNISSLLGGFQFGRGIAEDRRDQQAQQQKNKLEQQTLRVNNIAQESNALLQFDTPELLRANLIRRAQEVTANPVEGIDPADLIDMANRLGEENGFNSITAELKADLARAQEISGAARASGVQQAVNVPGVGFSTLTRGGVAKLVELPKEDQEKIAVALAADAERKAKEAGLKASELAGIELKTKPEIEGKVTTSKREAEVSTAAEIAEETKIGQQKGATAATITKAANEARRARPKVAAVRKALEAVSTGKLAQVKASLGQFIPGLNVDDEQVMQSQITQFVLDTLNKQSGTKTDFDFQKASEASAALGKTTEANKAILDILINNLDRSIAEQEQFKSFKREGGDTAEFIFKDDSEPTTPAVRRIQFDAQGNIIQ